MASRYDLAPAPFHDPFRPRAAVGAVAPNHAPNLVPVEALPPEPPPKTTTEQFIDFITPESVLATALFYPLVWSLPFPLVVAAFIGTRFVRRLK